MDFDEFLVVMGRGGELGYTLRDVLRAFELFASDGAWGGARPNAALLALGVEPHALIERRHAPGEPRDSARSARVAGKCSENPLKLANGVQDSIGWMVVGWQSTR